MKLSVQTIDLSKWQSGSPEDLDSIAHDWHRAFQGHGLVYLTNHGLESQLRRVCEEWLQFCRCDQEHKEQFSSPEYGRCGYNGVGKEAVAMSEDIQSAPDPVESLENGYSADFDGCFPRAENGYRHGDSLRDPYSELYHQMDKQVIRPCLDIASRALQLKDNSDFQTLWFEEGPGAYQLRLAHYVPNQRLEGERKYEDLALLLHLQETALCCMENTLTMMV